MALVACKECEQEVSSEATKCPNCGVRLKKSKRGFLGIVFKWLFILFNLLMVVWTFGAIGGLSEMQPATNEAEKAGQAIGATLGMGMLLTFWVMGDIILGLLVLFTRPKD